MLNEMKYAVALYREGSFSKAARSLFISQPALSSAIRKLENEVGIPLFDRSTSPIRPTEAGLFYIRSVQQVLAIEQNMNEYFESIRSLENGSLTIGTTTFYCCYSLPLHLKPFSSKYPDLHINLVEDTTNSSLSERLMKGDLDMVLTSNPATFEDFQKQFFTKEYLVLAVPSSYSVNDKLKASVLSYDDVLAGKHKLSSTPGISLKELKDLPYISLRQESDLYHRSMDLFTNAGITPNIHTYTDQMPTSYYMTYYGYGYSIIRDTTLNIVPIPADSDPSKVVFYKIDDPLAIRDIYFYYRDLLYQSEAVRSFIKYTSETEAAKEGPTTK